MTNFIFRLSKLLLHIISVYVGYYGAIAAIRGLFDQSVLDKYPLLPVGICFALLVIVEHTYAYNLSKVVSVLKNRDFGFKLRVPVFGLAIAGGMSIVLGINGANQTPYYKRVLEKDKSLKLANVDSIKSALRVRLHRIDSAKKAEKKKQDKLYYSNTASLSKLVEKHQTSYLSAYYSEKIAKQLAKTNREKAKIDSMSNIDYTKDTSMFLPAIRMAEAKNQAITSKQEEKDMKTGYEMAAFSVIMQVFILFFTIASKPLKIKIKPVNIHFTKFNLVKSYTQNIVNNIGNMYSTENQPVTLKDLLRNADDKTKGYFLGKNGAKNTEGKLLIGERMIPILLAGKGFDSSIKDYCKSQGYSHSNLYAIRDYLTPLLQNAGFEVIQPRTRKKPEPDVFQQDSILEELSK